MLRVLRVVALFLAGVISTLAVLVATNQLDMPDLPFSKQTGAVQEAKDTKSAAQEAVRPKQPDLNAHARATVSKMTAEQKVGQLFMVVKKDFSPALAARFKPGGIIYFGNDLDTRKPKSIAVLSRKMQNRAVKAGAPLPLMVAVDQEYGNVNRIKNGATRFPGNMALGATQSEQLAQKAASIGGKELKAMGINVNLAPVGDVNYNAKNPVIGERSFGDNPQSVAKMTAAAALGYQSSGIAATVKHFPGHGNAATDSHTSLPVIDGSAEEFIKMNLPPFRSVASTADAVMSAHIAVPALDATGLPATLSHKLLTGILRSQLGFKGVVFTDSLGMAGVRKQGTSGQIAVKAVRAGADVLLMPPDLSAAHKAVMAAVKSGKISQKRLDDSVFRIVRLKLKLGLDKPNRGIDVSGVGSKRSLQVAGQVARKSITVIKPRGGFKPVGTGSKILVTGWGSSTPGVLGSFLPGSTSKPLGDAISAASIEQTAAEAKSYTAVVVVTYGTQGVSLANRLIRSGHKGVYVVPTGTPYYAASIKGAEAIVTGYGFQPVSLKAVANVLTGKAKATGKLPVRLP